MGYQKNQEFYEQLTQQEREDFEREELKRLEREKKWEKRMERYRSRSTATSGGGGGSSASGSTRDTLSDNDDMSEDSAELLGALDSQKSVNKGPKFHGNFIERAKLQEQMKRKRTKKVNTAFSMPEQSEEIEITTGSDVTKDTKSPWAKKNSGAIKRGGNKSSAAAATDNKPSDWLNKMFDKS